MTGLGNIQFILSVKLGAAQTFLFDGQAWRHDSMQLVVTAIIKCLSKLCFWFSWPSLKIICSIYYQSQVHNKYLCLMVRLENIIPRRLLVTTIYTCCTSTMHFSENMFCFMARLKNILQFLLSGKPFWRSGLKTWFQVNKNVQLFICNFHHKKNWVKNDVVKQNHYSIGLFFPSKIGS